MMAERRDTSTDHRTFSQRYGYEPLPRPMRLEELSDNLRREIWNAIRESFLEKSLETGRTFYSDAYQFLRGILGKLLEIPEDEIKNDYVSVSKEFKDVVLKGRFNSVLDLVQMIINTGYTQNLSTSYEAAYKRAVDNYGLDRIYNRSEAAQHIESLFNRHASAYRLDTSKRPFRFSPRSSKEQGEATKQAVGTVRESGMDGAATHLRQATEHINARQYADSIADSISAVESAARTIDPKASKALGPALDSLERVGLLKHPALKEAFKKLYGYTSNEQGIRHALLDKDSADVGLDEAMFMFGACASFAAYLVSKHQQTEQQQDRSR